MAEAAAEITGPSGPGWVVELTAHHFFNSDRAFVGDAHVRRSLIKMLEEGEIDLPINPDEPNVTERFTLKELGIDYIITARGVLNRRYRMKNPEYEGDTFGGEGAMGGYGDAGGYGEAGGYGDAGDGGGFEPGVGGAGPGMGLGPGMGPSMGPGMGPQNGNGKQKDGEEEDEIEAEFIVPRYDFVVQFVWQEKRLSERLEQRRKEREEQQQQQAQDALDGDLAMTDDGGN